MRKSKYIGKILNGFEVLESQCVNKVTYYKVKCIYCNKETLRNCNHITSGKGKCKCQYNYGKEHTWNYIDGRSKDRIYSIYLNIKHKCYKNSNPQFYLYGGRGIKMCDEWLNDYQTFKNWSYENGYDSKATKNSCTIDRINVNGDYEPSNCRWVSQKEQAMNRRTCKWYKNQKCKIM